MAFSPRFSLSEDVRGRAIVMDLKAEFPLPTQTSTADQLTLLAVREMVSSRGPYRYLEIGSFRGGSLAPFLRDPHCVKVLSIDRREQAVPDERGTRFDYGGVTNQSMLDGLKTAGLDTQIIETFDGSVDAIEAHPYRYDLALIDGEHTDIACFRDYVHAERLLMDDALVLFHDSSLVSKALRMICEMLRARRTPFAFFKVASSEVSVIALGAYAAIDPSARFEIETDLEAFYERAERQMILSVAQSRIAFKMVVRDMPTARAW